MKFNFSDKTNFDNRDYISLASEFIPYSQEILGWETPVEIILLSDTENNKNPLGKTGWYNPDTREIGVYCDDRHIKDMLRSLSHELVHHWQNEVGKLTPIEEGDVNYAQNDKNLRECEKEAYLKGNMIFRDWEDQYKKNTIKENAKIILTEKIDNKLLQINKIYNSAKDFDIKPTCDLWIGWSDQILNEGQIISIDLIDEKKWGNFRKINLQENKDTAVKEIFPLLNKIYENMSTQNAQDFIPDLLKDQILQQIKYEPTSENPNWIASITYSQKEIELDIYWIKLDQNNIKIIEDSSLYGKDILPYVFDSVKEAQEYALNKVEEKEYESKVHSVSTFKEGEEQPLSRKYADHHQQNISLNNRMYEAKIKKLNKKFNINLKLED